MLSICRVLALAALALTVSSARADLIGDEIAAEAGLTPIDGGGGGNTIFGRYPRFVAPGASDFYGQDGYSVTGRQITTTIIRFVTFQDADFEFDDLSRDPHITGVSLDPASTITA